jgi:CspA family cold shock protein
MKIMKKVMMLVMMVVLLNTTLTTISAKTAITADSALEVSTMQTGTVKFFNKAKGFGFIITDQGGDDIFFNLSVVKEEVREGDRVRFTVADGRKGLMAIEVRQA